MGRAYAGDHDLFNIVEGKGVLVGEFTERSVYGCNGIGSTHKQRFDQAGRFLGKIKADDFGGAAADINADNNSGTHDCAS